MGIRGYQGVEPVNVDDRPTREHLSTMHKFLKGVERRLSTQQTTTTAPGGGIVQSISEDSGVKIIGDINFVSGTNIDLTQSGQDITIAFTGVGTTDHGALTGLSDDDHTQYILVAGTRAFTGNQSMGGFGFTNVDDIAGESANLLELISTQTDAVDSEAIRINWDANKATPSDRAAMLTVGYTDNGDVFQEGFSFEQEGTIGPMLRLAGGYGTRSYLAHGTSVTPKTWFELRDTQIEFRVNARGAFRVTHTGASPGVAQWLLLGTVDEFRFNYSSSASVNSTDAALYRFRNDVARTRGDFFQIDNASTDLFLIDHTGSITSTNKIRQTTSDANQLSAEKSFFTIDAGIATWEVDTTYTNQRYYRFNIPTLTINSTKTITAASTVYIEGAPTNAGSGTLTTALSLWVDAGDAKFDEAVLAYESRDVIRYSLMGM